MNKNFRIAFAAALLGSVAVPAFAADLPSAKAAPAYVPADRNFRTSRMKSGRSAGPRDVMRLPWTTTA